MRLQYIMFFFIKKSYLVFGSLKMIKKRVHLTIGIITLGVHGNECPSCELLSGIIKEWGDAWASVATARMPAGGSLTHSLATSRTSCSGFLQATRTLDFWAHRAPEDGTEANVSRWIACPAGLYDAWGCQARNDWLIIRGLCSAASDWHVAFFHLKKLSNELR